MIHKRLYFVSLIIVLTGSGFVGACSSLRQIADREAPWPTKEWQTSTPEEQNMDAEELSEMM